MLSQAPMMADPARWRTMMYEAFWLGKEPELTPEERRDREQRRSAEARQMIGAPAAQSELAAMQELAERAAQLREGSDQ